MSVTTTRIAACCLFTIGAFAFGDEREGGRRSAEGEGGQRRSAEGPGKRDGDQPLQGFKPQMQREAALYQMLQQLQREVSALRREVQSQKRPGEGNSSQYEGASERRETDARGDSPREGDSAPRASSAQVAKYRKQFQAFDKNGNGRVSLEERIAMKNYEVTGERLLNETLYHLYEDFNRDGGITLEEFAAYRSVKRRQGWTQGKLLSVNIGDGVITVESRGGEGQSADAKQSIRVEPKAIIAVKGQETKLSGLQTGQPIYLFMSHDNQSAIGLTQR